MTDDIIRQGDLVRIKLHRFENFSSARGWNGVNGLAIKIVPFIFSAVIDGKLVTSLSDEDDILVFHPTPPSVFSGERRPHLIEWRRSSLEKIC